ncbi:MAG TPA: hypothetical protein VGP99_06210 [Tepidisphaeraceae bacterium]|jgi:hypothetical protein|nr:hypothetical protein [Tepidisphaeraceae bacterium]
MLKSLLWAFFLACSWTWCIGMFLPVLLVRNWGIWGWVVFAVPNVIGAAAMGFVIRSRQSSEDILINHKVAIAIFSLVTVAFHIYFVYWFVAERLMGPWLLVIPVAAFFLMWGAGRQSPQTDPVMAAIVWVLSMAVFAVIAWDTGWKLDLPAARWPAYEVLWLLPVCIVGFALCPYLDATFHRTRMATGDRAPLVFAFGFGVFFLCMILFTLWYTKPVAAAIYPGNFSSISRAVVLAIGCHMSIQSAFTVAIHVRELERMQMPMRFRLGALVVLFVAVLAAAIVSKTDLQRWLGVNGGEAGYWLFMGCYTVAVPAYVWVFMLPRRPIKRRLLVLVVIAGICLPLMWLAIIHRQMYLLPVAVAIVIASRWLIPKRV